MTTSLSLIFKDEIPQIKAIIDRNKDIFDEIVLTCTNEDAYGVAEKLFKGVKLDYFEWVDDFSAARNHNLKNITTDYWVWMDADDDVDFSPLPDLIKEMDSLDAMYLPYNYAQDETGECIALHWRERIIRRSHPFEWKGALHETLISPEAPRIGKNSQIIYNHDNPPEKAGESLERNIKILEREYEKGDPRTTHYLGVSYFGAGRYPEAIKLLREHIQHSGWEEESYRSQLKIAEAYNLLDKPDLAINEALTATKVMTEYPDAYLLLAQFYFEQQEFQKCLEWLKVANTKETPDTLSITDPTMYGYRATIRS